MTDEIGLFIGIPTFSVTMRPLGGPEAQISLGYEEGRRRTFAFLIERERLPGGADCALAFLSEAFESLCGLVAGREDPEGELDLGSLVGRPGQIVLKRRGLSVTLEVRGEKTASFGSESIIVLEVLAGFGEALAAIALNDARKAEWAAVLSHCDLLPFGAEAEPLGYSQANLDRETAWYAERVGQDLDTYRLAAVWLTSRQYLYAAGLLPDEPQRKEWNLAAAHELPSADVVWQMARTAAAAVGIEYGEIVASALAARNSDARRLVVFEWWYGKNN